MRQCLRYDVSGAGYLDVDEMRQALGKMFLFNQAGQATRG